MTRKKEKDVIKKIKIAMIESGFNQVSLAEKMGKTHSAINKMLNGSSAITMSNLEKIAALTNRPVNYFFDNSGSVKGNNNVVGSNNNTVSADVQKDIKLLSTQVELLTAKIKLLEHKVEHLEKMNTPYPFGHEQ